MMTTAAIIREGQPRHFVKMICHAVFGVPKRRPSAVKLRGSALHRNSRKRLNRQAQCEKHDDDQFAPIGHGDEV